MGLTNCQPHFVLAHKLSHSNFIVLGFNVSIELRMRAYERKGTSQFKTESQATFHNKELSAISDIIPF